MDKKIQKLSELSLKQREILFKTLRITLTHHSNALEGSTLSFGETKMLLEKGVTANGKPISEQLITLGFADGYDTVIREANNRNLELTSAFIKDLHGIIFDYANKVCPEYVRKPVGAYRFENAEISGSSISLCDPALISQKLENLLCRFPSNSMTMAEIAEFHAGFEQIHPFADGNGRVGRLLIAFQSIQNDLIPPLVKIENRDNYLSLLEKAQSSHDFSKLASFLKKCQEQSLNFIENPVDF